MKSVMISRRQNRVVSRLPYIEERLAREEANPSPADQAVAGAYRLQLNRIDQFLASLDGDILDQLREIVSAVAVMELRAAGKFV
jgi:hypothetical protein